MTSYQQLLKDLRACLPAIKDAGERTLRECWNSCERPDWMLWLLARMAGEPGWPTHKEIVLIVVRCAARALRYVEDSAPRKVLRIVCCWIRGEVTSEEMGRSIHVVLAAYKRVECRIHSGYAVDSTLYAVSYAASGGAEAASATAMYSLGAAIYAKGGPGLYRVEKCMAQMIRHYIPSRRLPNIGCDTDDGKGEMK